jgi:hypothetical protein
MYLYLVHWTNPLSIYAKLYKLHIGVKVSLKIAQIYEATFFKVVEWTLLKIMR